MQGIILIQRGYYKVVKNQSCQLKYRKCIWIESDQDGEIEKNNI